MTAESTRATPWNDAFKGSQEPTSRMGSVRSDLPNCGAGLGLGLMPQLYATGVLAVPAAGGTLPTASAVLAIPRHDGCRLCGQPAISKGFSTPYGRRLAVS